MDGTIGYPPAPNFLKIAIVATGAAFVLVVIVWDVTAWYRGFFRTSKFFRRAPEPCVVSVPQPEVEPMTAKLETVEWRRCDASGCNLEYPHCYGSTSSLCAPCFAVAERLRCLHILEGRQAELFRALKYGGFDEKKIDELKAKHEALEQAADVIRSLPELAE